MNESSNSYEGIHDMTYIQQTGISNIHDTATSLGRFIARPRNRLGNAFGKVMQVASAAVSSAGAISGVDGDYAAILQQQMEMQRQMMTVSMISNVERTRHETNMVGVRNMRVS